MRNQQCEGTNINNRNGSTLIEVMISILVYTIGLISLMAVLAQSFSSGKQSDSTYTAYNIAKNHLERLKAVNFSTLASASETATLINQNGSPDSNGPYSRTTVVATNYRGFTNLVQVAVSVTCTTEGKESAATTVTTVIYGG